MNEISHLSVAAVKAIHREVIKANGGADGLRNKALLESAIAAPKASFGGHPIISDPIEVAAAYLFYLCNNHPFVDGNKRVALASCLVFLDQNKLLASSALPVDDWEAFVLDVAASRLDRQGTTARLRELLAILPRVTICDLGRTGS
jgi:death-on-curing protein